MTLLKKRIEATDRKIDELKEARKVAQKASFRARRMTGRGKVTPGLSARDSCDARCAIDQRSVG
ncbi:hypothetical protein F6X37_35220 [Paraburkholderia sp. 31.1]|uniref:hypothetical protein n=1 Tax=Paraburkholderia sp. 31.1 TaxID=2615205 RepID=UPI001655244D|nr:hypothetical protein [Paraburkholderia sp. 31.1]MBC8726566.1 hypothetical protein [Paraburkholderia sp. 31.1]